MSTYVNYISISDPSQRWKLLKNGTLKDKKGLWQSDLSWIFKNNTGGKIYIKNNNNIKIRVLGAGSLDKVSIVDLIEERPGPGQLWIQGKPDTEGYTTLENSKSKKLLTAISTWSQEVKGKCISDPYISSQMLFWN